MWCYLKRHVALWCYLKRHQMSCEETCGVGVAHKEPLNAEEHVKMKIHEKSIDMSRHV